MFVAMIIYHRRDELCVFREAGRSTCSRYLSSVQSYRGRLCYTQDTQIYHGYDIVILAMIVMILDHIDQSTCTYW